MAVGPMSPSMCQNWEVVLWDGGGRKERGGGRGVEGQGY